MITLTSWLTLINLLFVIAVPITAFIALRFGFTKAAEAAEKRVRAALTEENIILQTKVDRLEFEVTAMREALKEEGIYITIDGERVTIKRTSTPDTTRHIIKKPKTTAVRKTEEKEE